VGEPVPVPVSVSVPGVVSVWTVFEQQEKRTVEED
jgi:nitrate reductase NapAB chaperone NapD